MPGPRHDRFGGATPSPSALSASGTPPHDRCTPGDLRPLAGSATNFLSESVTRGVIKANGASVRARMCAHSGVARFPPRDHEPSAAKPRLPLMEAMESTNSRRRDIAHHECRAGGAMPERARSCVCGSAEYLIQLRDRGAVLRPYPGRHRTESARDLHVSRSSLFAPSLRAPCRPRNAIWQHPVAIERLANESERSHDRYRSGDAWGNAPAERTRASSALRQSLGRSVRLNRTHAAPFG